MENKVSKKLFLAYIGLLFATFITEFVICGSGVYVYSAMAQFDSLSIMGLCFTFESLARCVMLPVSGKLGDKFGRKRTFMIGMIGYAVAAVICAMSQSGVMFIIGRTLMGLTWGLFMVNMLVMIADIFGVEKSPSYAGYYQSILIVAMVIAAPVCGVLSDVAGWRTIFWLSVPFSLVAALLIGVNMPSEQERKTAPIDYAGIVLLTVMLAPFSLAMSWGGSTYAWNSPMIITLLAIFAVALIALIIVERKATDAIIPVRLFNNRSYMAMMGMTAIFCLFQAVTNYVPSYLQAVLGKSATVSSVVGVPGTVISVILASVLGKLVEKKGRFKGITAVFTFGTIACGVAYVFVGTGATFLIFIAVATILGIMNSFQQVAPYTYPYVAIEEKDLSDSLSFITFSTVVTNTLGNAIFGGLMNVGFDFMFKCSVIVAVLMLPCWLLFKDKD